MPHQRDPLGPLDFIVSALGTLFLVGVVGGGLLVVFSDNVSIGAFGQSDVCASYSADSLGGVRDLGSDRPDPLAAYLAHPVKPSYTRGTDFETCAGRPTGTMRALADATTVLDLGFFGIALALLWRLTRTARRRGLFTLAVSRQISTLGWFLLLGTLAVGVLKAFLEGELVHLVVAAPTYRAIQQGVDISLTLVIVGFGLLTLGRVMSRTVEMREEIDATV